MAGCQGERVCSSSMIRGMDILCALQYRQVEKLHLQPLYHTIELEGWGGGCSKLMQYVSVWVSKQSWLHSNC